MKLLNKTLVQYRNSRIHLVIYVPLSVNDRSLIIINNRHNIKQSVRTIISNKQSRFRHHQIHCSFLQFFMNWSDDDLTRNFSRFNFSRICWAICLNRSIFCDRMRVSTSSFLNNRNVAKSEININNLHVLLEETEVFDVTFQ